MPAWSLAGSVGGKHGRAVAHPRPRLEAQGILESVSGRIAVGWLIVEDLVTVLILVLLPALAASLGGQPIGSESAGHDNGNGQLLSAFGVVLDKFVRFVVFMLLVGARLLPWLLERVASTNSRELFTLAVVAAAIGIGFGAAELFGLSFALGAFFAGVVVGESDHSHRGGGVTAASRCFQRSLLCSDGNAL